LWLGFCALAGCETLAGQVYGFGLYSDVLRRPEGLALSQEALETVALCGNLGQYFRVFGGVAFDNLGGKVTIVTGLLMSAAGYLAIYFAVHFASQDDGWRASLGSLCIGAFLYGQGAGWIETTVISTSMQHFPDEAIGLLKTFFGIAAATGSLYYAAVLSPSKEGLLLSLGVAPLLFGLPMALGGIPMRPPEARTKALGKAAPWNAAYGLCFLCAVFLCGHSVIASVTTWLRPYEEHRTENMFSFGILLGLITWLPLLAFASSWWSSSQQQKENTTVPHLAVQDLSIGETLRSRNFWFLFLAFACGCGAGIMTINSMGQLVKAVDGGSAGLQPVGVSLFSIFNASGRLAMGRAAASGRFRRTQLFAGALLVTGLVYVAFALEQRRSIMLISIPLLGFGYGCLWSLQPLLIAELFGKRRDFGSKYGILAIAAVLGSTPLVEVAVPYFYNQYADDDGFCRGPGCFRGSLLTAALSCAVGAMLAGFLDRSVQNAVAYPLGSPIEVPSEIESSPRGQLEALARGERPGHS